MSHAEKCPICKGEGMVYPYTSGTGDTGKIKCHGCNGKGWVTVD